VRRTAEAVPDRGALAAAIDRPVHSLQPIGGGDHRRAYRVETNTGPLFLKCAAGEGEQDFAAEAAGLEALAEARAIRIPKVLAFGSAAGFAFLALEWIDFSTADRACEHRLGAGLAQLHQMSGPGFGWDRDNTLGATPQINGWHGDWAGFFAEQRLGVQLDLARSNGAERDLLARGERLRERLPAFFQDYRPQPALLHGDLWGGNWAADASGEPVLFDPAVYYGDREADLAMTRLFGGFGSAFYSAYQAAWPLDAGAGARIALYNLYHVLNHFNLFGGSYAGQALRMIDALLAADADCRRGQSR
jgi:fructosamine-3-kinase